MLTTTKTDSKSTKGNAAANLVMPKTKKLDKNGFNGFESLEAVGVQTKLTIGQPGDRYEQEANAVADKVVSRPSSQTGFRQPVPSNVQKKPLAVNITPWVQKQNKEDVSSVASLSSIALTKEEAKEEEKEEPITDTLQKKENEDDELRPKLQLQEDVSAGTAKEDKEIAPKLIQKQEAEKEAQEEDKEPIQLKRFSPEANSSSPTLERRLGNSKGSGSRLPDDTRSFMETRIGADFSQAKVHADSSAVQMNKELNAQAFTHGNDIYFNQGKYDPESSSGKKLLAHELTHTIQQGARVQTKEAETQKDEEIDIESPGNESDVDSITSAKLDSVSDTTNAESSTEDQSGKTTSAKTVNKPIIAPDAYEGETDIKEEKKEEKEIEETKSPIKRLALSAPGEEETTKVESIAFEGSSEQTVVSYTEASASQIAASTNTFGDAVNSKLGAEKNKAATTAPKLIAGTSGVEDPQKTPLKDPGKGKDADLSDGVKSGEPSPTILIPHKNREDDSVKGPKVSDDSKPKEKAGWLDWLFGKFRNALGVIKTNDSGVNTSAGKSPSIDTRGKADPKRATNVRDEGNKEVNREKAKTAKEIQNNPGQQNVQPHYFKEEKPVKINREVGSSAVSKQDNNMADFLNLPLPESVRSEADKDLAPALEKSMAEEKAKAKKAATTRDEDRKAEVTKAESETQRLNEEAGKEQDKTIKENRKKIADEQNKGVKEAGAELKSFNVEADKEQKGADKLIKDRIKKDNKDAHKKLKDAENEAENKRKEEEKKAREEKAKAERESKNKSWWGKFKDAVSSAVKWVTDKISKAFKALKKWVGELIDKAKKAALALIEAGRKWIVDKLDKFGKWLKSKVNKYLKNFPALRKRINKFIDDTVDGAKKFVNKIADDLKKGVEALAGALTAAINKLLDVFETILTAAVGIIGAVITGDFAAALKIAFMATCKIAGIDPNPILDFINRAGETIGKIFRDPIGFFKNVGKGIGQGISQFVTNIKKHLISGLITWLTGAMSDVPIQLPTKWDLKGIFDLILQILGLTYQQLRVKLVKQLGSKGEQIVSAMEKTVDFVIDFVKRGPIVLWEKIKNKFTEIKNMAMEKIRNAVIVEVVKAGVKWLIGLMNPASAIVKAVLMLYDLVMFFIEKKDQIVAFVTSVFDTVGPLARGEIGKAANFIEKALGKSVPVILGLLASLAGIGGIGKSVTKAINAIRGPVNKVVDPVIKWIAGIGKKMIAKGQMLIKKGKAYVKGKVAKGKEKLQEVKGKVFGWWKIKKAFKDKSGESHSIYFKGKGKSATLIVASVPKGVKKLLAERKKEGLNQNELVHFNNANRIWKSIEKITILSESQESKDITKESKTLDALLDKIADELIALGIDTDKEIPLTKVTYSMKGKRAGKVIAEPLTSKSGNTKGSKPRLPPDNDIEGWDYVKLIRKNNSEWVRLHLLNHNLHGPGNQKWNLTPGLSRPTNLKWMYNEVEKYAKIDVKEDVLWYETEIFYNHREFPSFPSKIAMSYGKMKKSGNKYTGRESRKPTPPPFTIPPPPKKKDGDKELNEQDLKKIN